MSGGKKSKKRKKSDSAGLEKRRKGTQVTHNREVGIAKQKIDEVRYAMAGYNTETKKTGCDFIATRGKEHLFVESKASKTAPMRPKQKEMQKKKGRNYRVERGLLD